MVEVAPEVFRLKLPVPFPVEYVNLYLLQAGGDYILVDCGPYVPGALACLQEALAQAGVESGRIRYLVVTHHHLDHYGLAGEVRRLTLAQLIMHEREAAAADFYFGPNAEDSASIELYRSFGMPEEELENLKGLRQQAMSWVSYCSADVRLKEEVALPMGFSCWKVIFTPGHAPGHICLYREQDGLLIAGDHLLLEITPNVSISVVSRPNPLRDYFDSLQKTRKMKVTRVLPAHGPEFNHASRRAEEIYQHHLRRKGDMLSLMKDSSPDRVGTTSEKDGGVSPYQVALDYFGRDLAPLDHWFALGETMAHLEALRGEGKVQKSQKDGRIYYYPTASSAR